jgi:ABC-type multidrug transport system ATPase subunit/pSer/pThr/pTyr-binding forkhead associated (FHA) protein
MLSRTVASNTPAGADPDPSPGAVSELELIVDNHTVVVQPGRPFVIGRGPEADLDLDHPTVSRRHLVLQAGPAGWQLTDHSSNGTFLDGSRIRSTLVVQDMTVHLGTVSDHATLRLRPRTAADRSAELSAAGQGRLAQLHHLGRDTIRLGRSPENDVVLDDLLVSRRHAQLRRTETGWVVQDLGSPNGTFVNARRVTESAVADGDLIGIGRIRLRLEGDRVAVLVDDGGNSFEATELTVTTGNGKTLLQSVGFALPPSSLLAVIGPSGAGKSTLLNALTGTRPATSGTVHYAGRDLYTDYDELRHRVALVPQDDVLHTQLTVRQALSYAARLRFPADTTPAERDRRIEEVIDELGLSGHAEQRITSLSGGQRKRTSVALELLTKPSLLFLDEPTSGLDPGMDRSVMHTLRGLADDGRTVVVVTHSITNLEVCDRLLLLAPGGWVAYFGPPTEALRYFERHDFTDIFLLLATAPGEVWAGRFRDSPDYHRYMPQPRPSGPSSAVAPTPPPRQQSAMTQLGVLCRRYLAVIASDRPYVVFLAALPLVLSLLARAVPGSAGLSVSASIAADDPQPRQLLLVLIIGAALMGAAASMRELVKERPIYRRERAIGLSIGAYLSSKILVLTAITGLQAACFTLLGLAGRNGPDNALVLGPGRIEVIVAVLAVTVTSMLTGLLISAAIDNADRGMPLLVLIIMVQLILCGGLFEVNGRPVLEQAAWFVPARWGFAMTAATSDVGKLIRGTPDPLWKHSADAWVFNAVALGLIGLVMTALIALATKRLDPQLKSRR